MCHRDRANTPTLLQNQLSPMFELDPLFKRTFLLALSIFDMSKVLKRGSFSLFEVCWTLLRVVKERDRPLILTEEEVNFLVAIFTDMTCKTSLYISTLSKVKATLKNLS